MDPNSLIQRYMIGDLSEEETQQLDRMLAEDAKLRKSFVIAAATDSRLREVAFQRATEPIQPVVENKTNNLSRRLAWIMSIAALIMLVISFGPTLFRQASVATLESSEHAAWESSLPTTPGSELEPGLLSLKSGVATLRFHSGAQVVIAAPAHLELVDPMRAKLLSGSAVIDVPEPAIGFVLETPDGYAVDYGTQFAVRVDEGSQQSDFELIQGEIAVHHPPTGDEVRLVGQGKTATVSQQSLVVGDSLADGDRDAMSPSRVIRIGTNGRSGSVVRNNKRKRFIDPEVLSVKRTKRENWDENSFFAFDLSEVDLKQVDTARLRLNLVPSTRGNMAGLPKINRFAVYGLTNEAKQNWQIESLWEESPQPYDGVLLGTFEIPRSRQRGTFGIQNQNLLDFLKANQNKPVTLILVRETTQIEAKGLTHTFASDTHPESVGPKLEFTLTDSRKPSTP